MFTFYRQDVKGNFVPTSNANVNRFERVKIQLDTADWLSNVSYSLTGMGLNPLSLSLGTDQIRMPGYGQSSQKEFVSPGVNGTYMIQASWLDRVGILPIARRRNESFTFNVSDGVSTPRATSPKSSITNIGSGITSTLKTGSYLVWGVVALVGINFISKFK
jgi:hypothetical protein